MTIHEIAGVSESRLEKIRDMTKCNETLQVLTRTVTNGWPQYRNQCPEDIVPFRNFRDEIVVLNGVLLKGNRVIIPKYRQEEVLMKIHTGHQGIEKCRLRARDTVYWCGTNADIDNMVKKCNTCQHDQTAQQKEELIPIDATHPLEIVGSDMFHWRGDEYLLVVDYYSSYTIIRKLSSTTYGAIVNKLKLIFSEFGIPEIFISDNARQYDSAELRKFEAEYDFKHEASSPRYPQCNGKAERYVGVVKKTLQKAYEAREDPAIALLCLRTTPIETGLPSPAELLFGRKIQSNLPTITTTGKEKTSFRRREQWRRQCDDHTRDLKDIRPGQSVRVQDYVTKKWEPAVVKQKGNQPRSYIITSRDGAEYRRNRRHTRTTGETFTFQDTCHSDENMDGEHTVHRSEPATCDNPSNETEPIHIEEPPMSMTLHTGRRLADVCAHQNGLICKASVL